MNGVRAVASNNREDNTLLCRMTRRGEGSQGSHTLEAIPNQALPQKLLTVTLF